MEARFKQNATVYDAFVSSVSIKGTLAAVLRFMALECKVSSFECISDTSSDKRDDQL